MNILITGIEGFIAKNLHVRLEAIEGFKIFGTVRDESEKDLEKKIVQADLIFHLAGENRSDQTEDFKKNNLDLTNKICKLISKNKVQSPVIFASSLQITNNSDYGKSKKLAEHALEALSKEHGNTTVIYRLPGVFGKWARPNYNSVVATFCHNASRGITLDVHKRDEPIELIYIDDLVDAFISNSLNIDEIINMENKFHVINMDNTYKVSVNDLATTISSFEENRSLKKIDLISEGLYKALYSTYLTYLPKDNYTYSIDRHEDERGVFTEFIKSSSFGQVSFFTIKIGATRGGHYHHTKVEKFLVLTGKAQFTFKNIITKDTFDIVLEAKDSKVIETIPGLAHNIKNVGDELLIIMAYANEIFDENNPDTYQFDINEDE